MTPETIRSCRLRLRMTQPQFARRMHVSVRTIKRWEKGDCLPWGAGHAEMQKAKRRLFFRVWDELDEREAALERARQAPHDAT